MLCFVFYVKKIPHKVLCIFFEDLCNTQVQNPPLSCASISFASHPHLSAVLMIYHRSMIVYNQGGLL